MAMPAMPGAAFVVVKAELVLGGFEAVLDSPAMAFHRHQLLHGRALGAPCGEGQAGVSNVATDKKTPRPFSGKVVVVFTSVEIGQLKIGQSCQRGPLVPSPDAERCQAFLGRPCAIAEAVPATGCRLPQERNT
ncbi:hypothetical protein XH87_09050 [Bradyrhizobium sp. CCBAU 53415]|nr:hypothetical protein [Bradyrhizobium sp. CCBAU 53415]